MNCVFMTFKGMNENVKNLQSVLIFKAGWVKIRETNFWQDQIVMNTNLGSKLRQWEISCCWMFPLIFLWCTGWICSDLFSSDVLLIYLLRAWDKKRIVLCTLPYVVYTVDFFISSEFALVPISRKIFGWPPLMFFFFLFLRIIECTVYKV